MRSRITCRLGLALLLPFALHAQNVPGPKEFYFDEDAATTRPVAVVQGSDDAAQQRLLRMIERKDRNTDLAAAQLAHIAMSTGRTGTGNALYRTALEATGSRGARRQTVLWNYGWDLYRSGDHEAALGRWLAAYGDRLLNPEWVPPTLALALWKLDRRDEAVAWSAAAVRTWPARWSRPGDFAALLPGWRADERALLGEVHAAWVDDPPAWP